MIIIPGAYMFNEGSRDCDHHWEYFFVIEGSRDFEHHATSILNCQ